jgi:hypothetical protein
MGSRIRTSVVDGKQRPVARIVERAAVFVAYRGGLAGAFAMGACIAAVGFIVVLFLPEVPLRDRQNV